MRPLRKQEDKKENKSKIEGKESEFMYDTGSLITILDKTSTETVKSLPLTKLTTKQNDLKKQSKNGRSKNDETKIRGH